VLGVALDRGDRRAHIAAGAGRGRRRLGGDVEHTLLEGLIPERVEVARAGHAALARHDLGPPVIAEHRVVGLWLADPAQQAIDQRAGVEQRRDQRLGQAEHPRDRLGVAP